jgi:AcrR family transcriptional regulator
MPVQNRAAATRQKIIDAAVELFTDYGFAETGLNDITNCAGVTTGAFYYHFKSKEALAAAIIQQGWPKAWQVFTACTNSPSPGLENVIVMTFSLSELMKRDKSVWIANHLNGALGQLSEEGRRGFRKRATTFVNGVADSIPRSDIRDDVTPEAVGNMVWITVHGCHLLSDAMMDNVFTRLAESWRMVLPAMVTEESLPYFRQFLARTTTQFQPRVVDELSAKRYALLDLSGEQTG